MSVIIWSVACPYGAERVQTPTGRASHGFATRNERPEHMPAPSGCLHAAHAGQFQSTAGVRGGGEDGTAIGVPGTAERPQSP
eukprot:CAMPEP_0179294248 /NCGR_PEP_ID=MMETSP0797-20121207/43798_1 /TAXON_ID=47934 /ORGANISM="Dinophysis acuminata, Strain DAEP01" /LENGTH=81 /DNA_ID=CAMNT_0021003435 /DNA_START=17 /DNA_END=258 /DNA_ORIENTATION=+